MTVVVIGGGVAGLSAALAARQAGAAVELLEPDRFGGSALLSNGSLWTFTDRHDQTTHCPGMHAGVADLLRGQFAGMVQRLRDWGVVVRDRGPSLYGAATSFQVEPRQLVDAMSAAVSTGVTCRRERATALRSAGDGVVVTTDSGRQIHARRVVVSTGGIHDDDGLLAAAGLDHYRGLLARNRAHGGDGVGLIATAGGSLDGSPDGVYGHLVPDGLPAAEATSSLAAQYQSHAGMLVADDGTPLGGPGTDDHDLNRVLTRHPSRRGVLFFDAVASPPAIRSVVGGAQWASDRADFAEARGLPILRSTSTQSLIDDASRWFKAPLALTVRTALAAVLREAPFFAVRVQPSITHAGAGARVNHDLSAAGLPAVYVAGADIGRAFGDGYAGGLALALTTGIVAGEQAAADSERQPAESIR